MAADQIVVIFLLLCTLWIVIYSQSTCRPTGSDGIPFCCPYHYLHGNTCLECPAGYRVLYDDYNCSEPCEFPSYGARCGNVCDCSSTSCNHVNGCPVISTIEVFETTTSFESLKSSKYMTVDECPVGYLYLKDPYSCDPCDFPNYGYRCGRKGSVIVPKKTVITCMDVM